MRALLPVSLDIYAEVKEASMSLCIKIIINITKCLLYQELFCENTDLGYNTNEYQLGFQRLSKVISYNCGLHRHITARSLQDATGKENNRRVDISQGCSKSN